MYDQIQILKMGGNLEKLQEFPIIPKASSKT
jgi:hypothetical protein